MEFGGGTFFLYSVLQALLFFNNNATGQIMGSGTYCSQRGHQRGPYFAGASPGILQFSGNFTQTSTGSLAIGINGNNNEDEDNPQYDVLRVALSANLSRLA